MDALTQCINTTRAKGFDFDSHNKGTFHSRFNAKGFYLTSEISKIMVGCLSLISLNA